MADQYECRICGTVYLGLYCESNYCANLRSATENNINMEKKLHEKQKAKQQTNSEARTAETCSGKVVPLTGWGSEEMPQPGLCGGTDQISKEIQDSYQAQRKIDDLRYENEMLYVELGKLYLKYNRLKDLYKKASER